MENCNGLCELLDTTLRKAKKGLSNVLDNDADDLRDAEIDDVHHFLEIIHEAMTIKQMIAEKEK